MIIFLQLYNIQDVVLSEHIENSYDSKVVYKLMVWLHPNLEKLHRFKRSQQLDLF